DKVANWASPIALRQPGKSALILLQSPASLSANDPATGKEVWKLDMKCNFIASTIAAGGKLFVPVSGGVTALELPETGSPKSLWTNNKLRPGSASGVTQGNNVYTLNGPVLNCGNAADGSIK